MHACYMLYSRNEENKCLLHLVNSNGSMPAGNMSSNGLNLNSLPGLMPIFWDFFVVVIILVEF